MYQIFIHECGSCGKYTRQIAKIRNYAFRNGLYMSVNNSKYSKVTREDHARWLNRARLPVDQYTAIVVIDNKQVVRLDKWT